MVRCSISTTLWMTITSLIVNRVTGFLKFNSLRSPSGHLPSKNVENNYVESSPLEQQKHGFRKSLTILSKCLVAVAGFKSLNQANAADQSDGGSVALLETEGKIRSIPKDIDTGSFKLPYEHENLPFKQFLGKATIVCNMKIDDPQTSQQFPSLLEIFNKYSKDDLKVVLFPTEQGYFEPDDDETCRAKAKEYYGFGDYPRAVVFDKIDILGPSAHPLYNALTTMLPTPNGYERITLNYEKFLLDSTGKPVRRYPRKYSAYDMEADIIAVLKGEPLPEESPAFLKAWREAKREATKSEYAFRLNYNYYSAPDSMYKYNPAKDQMPQ